MINPYNIKKYAALILPPFLTTTAFAIGNMFYNFWAGLGAMLFSLLFCILISNMLLKNPFSNMLEGKGMLGINLDSTGILSFFNLRVLPPYLQGKFFGKEINDVFDRNCVFSIDPPNKEDGSVRYNNDGSVEMVMKKNIANKARFQALQYPCMIWNNHIKSFITKEFISEKEKDTTAEHGLLYLNRKVEELTSVMRDFARYVVETTKPKINFFQGKGGILLIVGVIIVFIIIAILFGPAIWSTLQNTAGGGAIGKAVNAGTNSLSTISPT